MASFSLQPPGSVWRVCGLNLNIRTSAQAGPAGRRASLGYVGGYAEILFESLVRRRVRVGVRRQLFPAPKPSGPLRPKSFEIPRPRRRLVSGAHVPRPRRLRAHTRAWRVLLIALRWRARCRSGPPRIKVVSCAALGPGKMSLISEERVSVSHPGPGCSHVTWLPAWRPRRPQATVG